MRQAPNTLSWDRARYASSKHCISKRLMARVIDSKHGSMSPTCKRGYERRMRILRSAQFLRSATVKRSRNGFALTSFSRLVRPVASALAMVEAASASSSAESAVQQTSPVVESEQTCQVEKVECPPELGPIAREEWDKVAPHLVAAGRLKPLDRSSLAVYCAAYATWLEASQTARSWQAFTGRQESAACSAALPYSGAPSGRRHCHR
jgi:hypothetical protein